RHLCRNTDSVGVSTNGCFAEYLVIPASNAFPVPDGIGDDIAAILDPLGNATHTALSFDLVGEDVLITGAGPIGAMAAAICRHVGARHVVITDVNDYRLSLAKKMGASKVVNVQKAELTDVMDELGMTEGFDVGMEMSGNDVALESLLEHLNNGGKLALLGIFPGKISIDLKHIVFKGLTVKGIYGREMFETWYKMISMLLSGLDLSKIVTHHYPVAKYKEAFKMMNSGKTGKVILDWEKK
ncbi:MAG: L-threonine 3-dehydrogenase, partial [Fibrobacteria bacterium]|nr:L-threonine 3-dehydrogenase [Fibrobacteria bacterium]